MLTSSRLNLAASAHAHCDFDSDFRFLRLFENIRIYVQVEIRFLVKKKHKVQPKSGHKYVFTKLCGALKIQEITEPEVTIRAGQF